MACCRRARRPARCDGVGKGRLMRHEVRTVLGTDPKGVQVTLGTLAFMLGVEGATDGSRGACGLALMG